MLSGVFCHIHFGLPFENSSWAMSVCCMSAIKFQNCDQLETLIVLQGFRCFYLPHSPDLRDQHTDDAAHYLHTRSKQKLLIVRPCVFVCLRELHCHKETYAFTSVGLEPIFELFSRFVLCFIYDSQSCWPSQYNAATVHVRVRLVGINTRSIACRWHIHKYFFFSFVFRKIERENKRNVFVADDLSQCKKMATQKTQKK